MGVCRADVRNAIQVGAWIVFFSAERGDDDKGITRYCIVAALCVERKIAHTAIVETSGNRRYRDYLNPLIRRVMARVGCVPIGRAPSDDRARECQGCGGSRNSSSDCARRWSVRKCRT